MACSCNKGSSNSGGGSTAVAPRTYTVVLPNGGGTKSYQTEVEAAAAAKRLGGTYRAGS